MQAQHGGFGYTVNSPWMLPSKRDGLLSPNMVGYQKDLEKEMEEIEYAVKIRYNRCRRKTELHLKEIAFLFNDI